MARILVVDDERVLLELYVEWLRREGYKVDQTIYPSDALAFCTTSQIDLLITDMRLPGKTGYELLKELNKKGVSMLTILMSGDLDLSDEIKKSFDEFLQKPFSKEEFLVSVNRVLQKPQQQKEF